MTEQQIVNASSKNKICFFVGMHNKPGMKPLDSRTKSGAIIDSIISRLPVFCVKTNLCEVDYFPKDKKEVWAGNIAWGEKYQPTPDSVIVLLGNWVHKNFLMSNSKIVKLPHPACCVRRGNKEEYVNNAVDLIKAAISCCPEYKH